MEENLMSGKIKNATSNETQSVYDGLGNVLINTGGFVLTRADFIYIYTGMLYENVSFVFTEFYFQCELINIFNLQQSSYL